MWFSKTQKKSEVKTGAAAPVRPMAVVGRANEPVRVVANNSAALSSPQQPDVIPIVETLHEIQKVPPGPSVTERWELGPEVEKEFIVIEEGPGAVCILCSEAIYGKPMMYQAQHKAARLGYKRVRVIRAGVEIFKALGDREIDAAQEISMHGSDATEAEKKASEIFEAAHVMGASDIHIETMDPYAEVTFRINGTREPYCQIAFRTAKQICTSIYSVHADATIKDTSWNAMKPKQAVIEHTLAGGKKISLRFSSSGRAPGENFHAVMRIASAVFRELGTLGFTDEMETIIKHLLIGSRGLVLLAGPTNAGKTTTLLAMLAYILSRRGKYTKIITVEDPVEQVLPGLNQTSVRRKATGELDGASMADYIEAALRQDPDVIGVGEMRDAEVANEVKQAALAGRKVLGTVHAPSGIGTFERLRELGIPVRLLTSPSFIAGIIFVRLVPTLCDCAIPIKDAIDTVDPLLLQRLKRVVDLNEHDVRIRKGCAQCDNTGVAGRTSCAEIILPGQDHKLLHLIAEDKLIEAEEHWRLTKSFGVEDLGPTVLAHAISKLRVGILDPADVEECIDSLDADVVAKEAALAARERVASLSSVGKK